MERNIFRKSTGGLWAALVFSSVFLGVSPAHAGGTAAGTSISNTATATYNDPNNSGQTLNATSNTVSIIVEEVAGLTVTPYAITDTTGGASVLPGHILNYDFTVTNVGNGVATKFVIPGATTITGPATAGTLSISSDNGATYSTVSGTGLTTAIIAPGGSVRIRQQVSVNAAAPSGAPISVLLGNTGANDNSAATQNQPYPTAPSGNDVYTTGGTPANGQREASGIQTVTTGAQPSAFAQVLLTHNTVVPATPLTNTVVTYNLGLNVNATVPAGASTSLVPADLAPTSITLEGSPATKVLLSDAIPVGMTLTGVPTAPSGWTVVYSTTAITAGSIANAAAWTATAPASLATVTRVGFIASGPITKGSTLTGFAFQSQTTGASLTNNTTFADLAQAFGQTVGDPSNSLVYDESGDALPSNFNDNGTPNTSAPRNGVAVPATDGLDNANNNTGTGSGGQDNIVTVAPAGTVSNGPKSNPNAVGPVDSNDDFTNQSAPVAAGLTPGSTITTALAPVTFTNTLLNPGTSAITSNTLLVPQSPSVVDGGSNSDIPNGTTATITYGSATAVYTYNGTSFAFTSGTAISIPNLPANTPLNYTVTIGLPANTVVLTGYSVPIRAFVDTNANGIYDAGEPSNITVDRVYTGFLRVTKQVQVVDTDGTTVIQAYTQTPTSVGLRPGRFLDYLITYANVSSAPAGSGNIILNAAGITINENGTLTPNTWALDQDGNGVIDTSNVIGSAVDSGIGATISFFSGATGATAATDQTGTTAATDVSKYVDVLTVPVTPTQSRTFHFRRKLN